MLQDIRDKSQGWFAWVVVGLIAIVFIFWGTSSIFSRQPKQVVAKVNGFEITQFDLDHFYERFLLQQGPERAAMFEPKKIKQYGLDVLIHEAAIKSETRKAGFRVSDTQVMQDITQDPAFAENGHFSPEKYQMLLSRNYFTPSQYQDFIKSRYLMMQLQYGLMQTNFSLNRDLKTLFKYLDQQRDFDYILVPEKAFLDQIKLKEDDIQAYYDAHKQDFMTEEMVKIQYINLDADAIKQEIQPTKKDLKQFYEEHIQLFSEAEKRKLAHILVAADLSDKEAAQKALEKVKTLQDKLEKGASFETLAKESSDDPVSANKGGELSWVTKGDESYVKPFRDASFSIKEKGAVSAPVETSYGYHLIKLLDIVKAKKSPLEEVKEEVKEQYRLSKAREIIYEKADTLVDQAYEHDDSLQPAADQIGLKVQTSDFFSRTGGKDEITKSSKVIQVAFSGEVLEEGHNSEVIEMDDDHFVVLRLADHKKPEQIPLNAVKPAIEVKLRETLANDMAQEKAKEFLQALQEETPMDVLVKGTPFELKHAKGVTRSDKEHPAGLITKAFEMYVPDGKLSMDMATLPDSYAVLVVKSVKDGSVENVEKDRVERLEKGLAESFGQIDFQLYTQEAKSNAKISYTERGKSLKSDKLILNSDAL